MITGVIKNKNLTTVNYETGSISRVKYIVIHYTANNGDTAYGNTSYFKSVYRDASAHYFVDENEIWQCVEDKNIAWHVGANSYKHPYCRNSNSIGIEMCSRKYGNGQYYFMEKTVDNAVELVKYLMAKYNVPTENVRRHYDVTGKICPEPYVRDTSAWNKFKNRLTEIEEDDEMITETNISVNGKNIKINRILKDGKNYIDLRGLENAGFKVSYNADTKLPSLDNDIKELAIEADGIDKIVRAVNLNGSNYVSVRDLSETTGTFDVDYENGKVIIKTK